MAREMVVYINKKLLKVLLIGLLALQGCAMPLPDTLAKPAIDDPGISRVRDNINQNLNTVVRWGGTITSIRNQAQDTVIEVVERSLNSNGRPRTSGPSGGRFIAKVEQFLDPEVFEVGAIITIFGVVSASEFRKIGEHQYEFPVVKVQTLHRWEPEVYYYPYPYSPFWYDPWYPYRYPYGGHHPYYPPSHPPSNRPNPWRSP